MASSHVWNNVVSVTVENYLCNISNHNPILLKCSLELEQVNVKQINFKPSPSWDRATDLDIDIYKQCVHDMIMQDLEIASDFLYCKDFDCNCTEHLAVKWPV